MLACAILILLLSLSSFNHIIYLLQLPLHLVITKRLTRSTLLPTI